MQDFFFCSFTCMLLKQNLAKVAQTAFEKLMEEQELV